MLSTAPSSEQQVTDMRLMVIMDENLPVGVFLARRKLADLTDTAVRSVRDDDRVRKALETFAIVHDSRKFKARETKINVMKMTCMRLVIGILMVTSPLTVEAGSAMHEVAVAAVRPAGAPEYADVCFRYGWVRSSFPTVQDAKDAMRDFHATRIDWFYPGPHTADPGAVYVSPEAQDFINWCHTNGMKIVGAINSNTTNLDWRLRDANFGRYVGDPGNPDYVDAAVAWGTAQIDAGVDALVCDDFFKYTAAEQQLFSDNVIAVIKAHKAGFKIAGNSGSFIGTDYVTPYAFDFHYSDSNFTPDPGDWWTAAKAHSAAQSALLSHPNRLMTTETRRTLIALGYASGAHVIAPWDEYISSVDGGGRLFEDPADFADLYGFARALGQQAYLNGYEDAAVGGYDLTETRYGANPPITVSGGSGTLSVFGRARPGQPGAPVVLHLVEWGTAQEATLRLHIPALFGTSEVDCTLLTLPVYTQAVHAATESSGNYETLSQAATLTSGVDGDFLVIDLPPMAPWGALVIAPATNSHSLEIHPAAATVFFPGETQNFLATVLDSTGTPVSPQSAFTWSVSGGSTIDATGLFTAGTMPATATVTARVVQESGETVIGSQHVVIQSDTFQGTARWPLNGDVLDSGGTHHGSLQGGAVFSTNRQEGSHSIVLDGTDDYVDIPDHPDLDIGTGDFSYALWFKRDANTTENLRLISKGGQDNSDPGYCVFGSDTGLSAVLCNGQTREIISASHGGVGVWTHLAVTIDRTGGWMKIYIDGAEAAHADIAAWTGQDLSSAYNLRLGRSSISLLCWDGGLDDVHVYQRVLSPAEVLNLATGVDRAAPAPNPMTWDVAPYATGMSSIRMTATTAAHTNGVEYWFDETSGHPGQTDSGWQDSPVFEATGLTPDTVYTYRVKARDKTGAPAYTAFSVELSAATDPAVYASWITEFDLDSADQDLDDDPDDDGMNNLLEAFYGTDPGVYTTNGPAAVSAATNALTFKHPHPDIPLEDITGFYEWSLDLQSWNAGGVTVNGTTVDISVSSNDPENNVSTVTGTHTGASPTNLFIRTTVTEN